MSEYLADLSMAWLPGLKLKRKWEMLDSYRMLARLPHPITWIEYDVHARYRRMATQWPRKQDAAAPYMPASTHSGWLLLQHPKIETAFMALTAESHGISSKDQTHHLRPNISAYPIVWTADDTPLPYRNLLITSPEPDEMDTVASLLTGIRKFSCPQLNLTVAPWVTGKLAQQFIEFRKADKAVLNHTGTLRVLWSLLAAINDTPMGVRHVTPAKGRMVGGSYKRFSEHSVIALNIPKRTTMIQLAKRILRTTRRRAHMVRGHWRRDWRFPLSPLCEHHFEPVPDTHLNRCTRCLGRKMWITEHQTGDASLGFVLHDYKVQH
jgi:hypothetical protein